MECYLYAHTKSGDRFITWLQQGGKLGLLALVEKTKSVRSKHSLGIFVSNEAYGPLIVPLVGLHYRGLDDRFEANILLPIRVDLNYQMEKVSWLGMNDNSLGTSYYIYNQIYKEAYINKSSN